jgi:outer membrane protein assembly factor BamA
MKKTELLKTLRNGISEITLADENGIETTLMATLASQHLPDDSEQQNTTSIVSFQVFNVNTEKWETHLVDSVIDVEQLTGEGAAVNETKLQASSEYLEQLSLFSGEDLDTMEHPEDL